MSRLLHIADARRRRLPRLWLLLTAIAAGASLGTLWSPSRTEPHRPHPPAPTQPLQAAHRAPPAPAAQPAPAPAARVAAPTGPALQARSTLIAPGVHSTPLSVPDGTTPVPAGPRPHDSEPEN